MVRVAPVPNHCLLLPFSVFCGMFFIKMANLKKMPYRFQCKSPCALYHELMLLMFMSYFQREARQAAECLLRSKEVEYK